MILLYLIEIDFLYIFYLPIGFDILLKKLNDLSLDSPNASEILGNFIARAVADDCLPPAYVQNHHTTTDPHAL